MLMAGQRRLPGFAERQECLLLLYRFFIPQSGADCFSVTCLRFLYLTEWDPDKRKLSLKGLFLWYSMALIFCIPRYDGESETVSEGLH